MIQDLGIGDGHQCEHSKRTCDERSQNQTITFSYLTKSKKDIHMWGMRKSKFEQCMADNNQQWLRSTNYNRRHTDIVNIDVFHTTFTIDFQFRGEENERRESLIILFKAATMSSSRTTQNMIPLKFIWRVEMSKFPIYA